MIKVKEDLMGRKFTRLTVIRQVEDYVSISGKTRNSKWLCKCDCGNVKEIRVDYLKNEQTKSCGCLQRERASTASTTHGQSKNILYRTWANIKTRCYNPKSTKYEYWGGRGIIVCDEWKNSAETFIEWCLANGYKKGLQIDRVDNNDNYKPSNCKFVNSQENNLNKRVYDNNTSGYTGLYFIKVTQKWQVVIKNNKKSYYLGCYVTKKEALQVRSDFVIENNFKHKIQEWRG